MITPAQCLEARKLLKWSRDRLAPRCGISAAALSAFEAGATDLRPEVRRALRSVLAKAGIEFDTGEEPGVRLREREGRLALRTGRTRGLVAAILDELVGEGVLISYRTNFDGRGPVWIPTVSISVADIVDLAGVLERVEKALRPLGVAEVTVEELPRPGETRVSISSESIQVDRCYLTKSGFFRKVTSTGSDGCVHYKERIGSGPWLHGGTRKLRRHDFVAAVEREVPCDWTPETDEVSQ